MTRGLHCGFSGCLAVLDDGAGTHARGREAQHRDDERIDAVVQRLAR